MFEVFPLLLFLDRFPAFEVGVRLGGFAQPGQSFRHAVERLAHPGIELEGALVGGGRFFPAAEGLAGESQVGPGPGIPGFPAQLGSEGFDRLLVSLHVRENLSDTGPDSPGVRVVPQGHMAGLDRLRAAIRERINLGQGFVDVDRDGIKLESRPEELFGLFSHSEAFVDEAGIEQGPRPAGWHQGACPPGHGDGIFVEVLLGGQGEIRRGGIPAARERRQDGSQQDRRGWGAPQGANEGDSRFHHGDGSCWSCGPLASGACPDWRSSSCGAGPRRRKKR